MPHRPRGVALALSALMAASAAGAVELSWPEAVGLARKQNPDLRAAEFSVDAARAGLKSAYSGYLPELTGSAGVQHSQSGGSAVGREYALGMTGRLPLFSGLDTVLSVRSGRARLESAQADRLQSHADTVQQLRAKFVGALYAQENLKVLDKIQVRRGGNKRLITLRFEAGRENRGSVLRVEAQFAQAAFELEQASRALRLAYRDLARSLGEDAFRFEAVTGTLASPVFGDWPDFNALAEATPAFLKAQTGWKQALAERGRSRSAFFPELSLSGSGNRRGEDFDPKRESWSAGLTLTLPFFSGGRDFYAERQADANLKKALADLESVRRRIAVELEDAFIQLADTSGQTRVQEKFLEAAEERARIARAQYGNGLVSYQDWDIIENDLIQAEKSALDALQRTALAESSWILAQGRSWEAYER